MCKKVLNLVVDPQILTIIRVHPRTHLATGLRAFALIHLSWGAPHVAYHWVCMAGFFFKNFWSNGRFIFAEKENC